MKQIGLKEGKVYLVGAGPGDPGLITVRGLELLRKAEVVIYDYLANSVLLEEVRPEAELIYAGKKAHQHTLTQDKINALLVQYGREGKQVVRLKGGDPFVFGRGGEEAQVLREAGIKFEIVPGVSSAIAVPAYAGIPLTHRNFNSSFTVIAGHENPFEAISETNLNWEALSKTGGTLVFLMGLKYLEGIVARLIKAGHPLQIPVACIRWGTLPEQQIVTGTLETIVEQVRQAKFTPPVVIVVGEVVGLHEELGWYEPPPLGNSEIEVVKK